MRPLRNRSIPHADDRRLLDERNRLHGMLHTSQGLRSFDDTRRSMVDNGIKLILINAEIRNRGLDELECTHCRYRLMGL